MGLDATGETRQGPQSSDLRTLKPPGLLHDPLTLQDLPVVKHTFHRVCCRDRAGPCRAHLCSCAAITFPLLVTRAGTLSLPSPAPVPPSSRRLSNSSSFESVNFTTLSSHLPASPEHIFQDFRISPKIKYSNFMRIAVYVPTSA